MLLNIIIIIISSHHIVIVNVNQEKLVQNNKHLPLHQHQHNEMKMLIVIAVVFIVVAALRSLIECFIYIQLKKDKYKYTPVFIFPHFTWHYTKNIPYDVIIVDDGMEMFPGRVQCRFKAARPLYHFT